MLGRQASASPVPTGPSARSPAAEVGGSMRCLPIVSKVSLEARCRDLIRIRYVQSCRSESAFLRMIVVPVVPCAAGMIAVQHPLSRSLRRSTGKLTVLQACVSSTRRHSLADASRGPTACIAHWRVDDISETPCGRESASVCAVRCQPCDAAVRKPRLMQVAQKASRIRTTKLPLQKVPSRSAAPKKTAAVVRDHTHSSAVLASDEAPRV